MELLEVKKFLLPDLEKWAKEDPKQLINKPSGGTCSRKEWVKCIKQEKPEGMEFLQEVFNEAYKDWQDFGNGIVGMYKD